jgi:hypothetical protein
LLNEIAGGRIEEKAFSSVWNPASKATRQGISITIK